MEEFKDRLRILRKERGMTQKNVGELLDVTERNVRSYEAGDRFPEISGLLLLADYFDVSLDYLVGRSEERERR